MRILIVLLSMTTLSAFADYKCSVKKDSLFTLKKTSFSMNKDRRSRGVIFKVTEEVIEEGEFSYFVHGRMKCTDTDCSLKAQIETYDHTTHGIKTLKEVDEVELYGNDEAYFETEGQTTYQIKCRG